MNAREKRNAALAFVGLLALSIYILACTSFSPDDTKVLYPAFDAASGAIGMAVYDREARASEMLFVPVGYEGTETNATVAPGILRAQWLANGRDIVVVYTVPKSSNDDGLTVAVIPWGTRKPIKTFHVPGVNDAAESFIVPLCVAGERLFLRTASKAVLRLDLRTGALTSHDFKDAKGELFLYPAPDGAGVFYFEHNEPSDQPAVFGRLNPDDFSQTPLMEITNRMDYKTGVVAYDREGKTLVYLGTKDEKAGLTVWRDGRQIVSRSVNTRGQNRVFGNAILASNGKSILATFQQTDSTNAMSYGLMEIPLSEAPPREVTLIKEAPVQDDGCACYFQAAVSHDGKTAAVASTYLAVDDHPIQPADCALFFVDLSDPNWKVTKVPIPVPAQKPSKAK